MREGAQVAILGRPNAGKSSIFNRLAGAGRAIVTDIPGTTRDLLTEVLDLDGIAVTLVDTAGLRAAAADAVEQEGIARAHAAGRVADLIDRRARCVDVRSRQMTTSCSRPQPRAAASWCETSPISLLRGIRGCVDTPVMPVSARTGAGFDRLRAAIVAELSGGERLRDTPAVTNMRHVELLSRARAALGRARGRGGVGTPEEFVAADVSEARGLSRRGHGRADAGRCAARDLRSGSVSESSLQCKVSHARQPRQVPDFDVIVIGAGHAGVEAAWAAARLGRTRRDLHALGRHYRAHALQSRRRRDGEGAPGPGDRRARRADGAARSMRPASSSRC